MKTFMVSVRNTVEDSEYMVDAPDAGSAARIYLEAALSDGDDAISVDLEEVFNANIVDCREMPLPGDTARVRQWEGFTITQHVVTEIMPDFSERADLEDEPGPS